MDDVNVHTTTATSNALYPGTLQALQLTVDDVKPRYSMPISNGRCQGTLQPGRQQWTVSRHITAWQAAMDGVKEHYSMADSNGRCQGILQPGRQQWTV